MPQKLQGSLLHLRREAFAAMMECAINPLPAGSKVMVVSLPLALLAMDYWPLQRMNHEREGGFSWAELLPRLLAYPLTASLADDDPKTAEPRKQIIQSKPFLKAIYEEW